MRFIKKKEGEDSIKIRNTNEVTTGTAEIQKIIRENSEQFYTNKSDNLEEMNKFLETSPPKPNQEEISNLNRLITRSENRICHTHTYSLQAEVLDPMAEQENSTKHTKKNLYQFFPNSSKRLKRKEHPQRHSMKSPSP